MTTTRWLNSAKQIVGFRRAASSQQTYISAAYYTTALVYTDTHLCYINGLLLREIRYPFEIGRLVVECVSVCVCVSGPAYVCTSRTITTDENIRLNLRGCQLTFWPINQSSFNPFLTCTTPNKTASSSIKKDTGIWRFNYILHRIDINGRRIAEWKKKDREPTTDYLSKIYIWKSYGKFQPFRAPKHDETALPPCR